MDAGWADPTERRMHALESRVERAELQARRAMASRDRLASLLEKLRPYLHHDGLCQRSLPGRMRVFGAPCTCGLAVRPHQIGAGEGTDG